MSRAGVRRKGKINVCIMCRHPFQSSRWDAKTCTPKCRKAWERFQEKQDDLALSMDIKRQQDLRLDDLLNKIQDRVFARVK